MMMAIVKTLETILFSQGFGSRKQCRALILNGCVSIQDIVQTDPRALIDETQLIFYVNSIPWTYRKKLYIALNKPAGYECSHHPSHHKSIFSLFPQPFIQRNLQSVGRLDQDTTGLLLLSDDGQFIHRCTSPKYKIPKTYQINTKHPITSEQIEILKNGVLLHGESQPSLAIHAKICASHALELTITEGKYHQVKRMIAAAGNRVINLHRQQIGQFILPNQLQPGQWQYLCAADQSLLFS